MIAAAVALVALFGSQAESTEASAQNTTDMTFTDSGQSLGTGVSFGPALCDLDGDGDLDAFIPNYNANSKVWMNNGAGVFTNSGQNFTPTSGHGVDLGDLDGDGDIDAFLVYAEATGRVLLNNGSGIFTGTGQSIGLATDYANFVYLGDIDGDGDLDAAIFNYLHPNRIWLNDGTGHFTAGQALGDSTSGAMALGDLDVDGDLDIFMMSGAGNTILLNDGAGNFADSGQRMGYTDGWGHVKLADLDGNGSLDAFVTNAVHGNTVWLNDGAGNFVAGDSYTVAGTEKLALGDIEGDGDIDAFTTSRLLTNKVWLNDGDAHFTPVDSLFGTHVVSIAAGDVDSDGDLDVIVSREPTFGPTAVYFNTTPSAGIRPGETRPSTPLIWLNGPNPFDQKVELSYSVPDPGTFSIRLFDVLGREVRTIAGGSCNAGQHSTAFDGTDLASGAYLLRLEVNGSARQSIATFKIMCVR